jgi:hypothetical protein
MHILQDQEQQGSFDFGTLCLGHKEELELTYKEIQKKFKFEKLGRLKKQLTIWY